MPEIDYRDPRPIYEQLAGVFESLILSGALENLAGFLQIAAQEGLFKA